MTTVWMKRNNGKLPKRTPSIAVLDRWFSRFIRHRDTGTYPMDKAGKFSLSGKFIPMDGGYAKCFTCGKMKGFSDLDCGHYIGRQHYATRWDPKNCRSQCTDCNRWNEGQKGVFRVRLVEIYGEEEIASMEALRRSGRKPRGYEAAEILGRIKADLESLKVAS